MRRRIVLALAAAVLVAGLVVLFAVLAGRPYVTRETPNGCKVLSDLSVDCSHVRGS